MSQSFSKIVSYQQRIKRFRTMLGLFFTFLVLPVSLIVFYGFQKFESDMDFQYRWKSINSLKQVNQVLGKRMKVERSRPVDHYNFYLEVVNPLTNESSLELSPLADPARYQENYPDNLGIIGYFQINDANELSSPLLPNRNFDADPYITAVLEPNEIERRKQVLEQIRDILVNNDFELAETRFTAHNTPNSNSNVKKSVIELFQLKWTDNREMIVYRNVWLDQTHLIQGYILKQDVYIHDMITAIFNQSHYDNDVLMRFKGIRDYRGKNFYFLYNANSNQDARVTALDGSRSELGQQYIFHGSLIAPFQQMQLEFTTDEFPLGSASRFVALILWVLGCVIVLGFVGLYWIGIKNIALAEQRMNFVSSISHELKTPLTSMSMYSEMLKSGMVKDPRTQLDYSRFIHEECQRLTRLINNILKLSSLNQNQEVINIEKVSVAVLQDTIISKVSSMLNKHNFTLNFKFNGGVDHRSLMLVDLDAFSQIVINLVENSIKFFNAAQIDDKSRRKIDIEFSYHSKSKHKIDLTIRDYGPGIAEGQQQQLFDLFYREGNELTRSTPGTGIGLALVHELTVAQNGLISLKTEKPGLAFKLTFKSPQS